MSDEWKSETPKANDDKSWKLLEKVVLAGVQEQRRARRWGIFFKSLTFIYLFVVLLAFSPFGSLEKSASRSGSHTALIEVKGMIADDEPASADNIVTALRAAFKDEGTKGIVLRINSPGGSPVQSGYIYDEIRRLRGEHPNVKVYAVISDLGASGAYYIASAADQIYADKASLVGSIGVTAASFGFVGTMEKLGVERRVYTSGEHKSFLDPFQPQKPEETQFWQQVLDTTHKQFIDSVKRARRPAQGRGASGAVLGSGLVRRTGIAARFDRRSGQCQLCGARSGEGEEDRGLHRAGVAFRSLRQEVRCQCGGAPRAVDGLAGPGIALRAFPFLI